MEMRYLFRGLRADGEGWVYGCYYFDGRRHFIYVVNDNGIDESYCVVPETVGLWTGLRDKWEQMIFWGDIVIDTTQGLTGTISYEKDNAMFFIKCPEDDFLHGLDSRYDIEVIGNIHEG